MKIVVTGASGLLGRAVYARLKADGHTILGTAFSRANSENGLIKLDLTNFKELESFLDQNQPEVIIHTAAERRPDVVEKSPESCQILNVDLPGEIASWCKKQTKNVPLLINISTDYVFDGTSPPYKVDDSPNPLNAYGKSKWEGEKAVLENGKSGRVTNLRVPVLYGKTFSNDESAVNILLDALTVNGKPKKMDANAVRYPTNVDDIAKALSQMSSKYSLESSIPPTLHFSAMEAMTKYDMCLVMARCLRSVGEEAETEHLEPEYEVDPNAATSRPRHCKLDLSLTKEIGINTDCISFESWWKEYLEEYAVVAREKRAKEAIEAEARRVEEERRRKEEEEKERIRREEEEKERRRKEEEEKERLRIEEEERQIRVAAEEEEARKKAKIEEDRKRKEEEEEKEARKREAEENAKKEAEELNVTSEDKHSVTENGGEAEETEARETTQVEAGNISRGSNALSNPASSVGPASLRSPSSPNPSFSSLQARPTPPATSGRSSPSPSMRSIGASSLLTGSTTIPPRVEEDENGNIAESQLTENTVANTNPLNINDTIKLPTSSKDDTGKSTKQAEDGTGFFPQKLVEAGDGASLGIDVARPVEVDSSDNYGEPSPRENSTAKAPFMATGYGEITFGMDGSTIKEDYPKKDNQPSQTQSDNKPKKHSFQIKVGDPQKVGDPVTAHIVYTMRIITDSPLFRSSQFSVLRRYSDFRWLHAALVHNNPGIFIPPVPEKVKIGRFAPDLVEARRHGLESCINKIANNPVLQLDDDFKIFLESQNFHSDVKVRDQIKGPVPTPEQKTYFGWSTSFTGSSYKYHENDEWFEEQKVYLDHLELQLKNLVRIVSILAQQRKDFAAATSETSHALMMLSGSSLSRSLSTCFAGLGEVERRIFELADVQADADVREFGSVLYEFERMVGSARKAFATRIDQWQTWQRLEDEWKKVRIKHEKVKKDSQPGMQRANDGGRLPAVLDELATIETKCLNAKREFDLIGRRCKEEMDRFEYDRIRTFHDSCELWLQGMIERGYEIMSEWEQYAALLERQTNHKIEMD